MTPKECILIEKQAVGEEMTVLTLAHDLDGYKAGQYIFLEHEGKRRAYSLASHPDETGTFRLLVKTVAGGLSEYLTHIWEPKTPCTYMGPIGHFALPESVSASKIVYIGAGSGIAPFPALLTEATKKGLQDSVICLLWAKNWQEWADLKAAFPILEQDNVIPCLTRVTDEEQARADSFFAGRTTQKMAELELTPDTLVYICGSLNLIQDVQTLCAHYGIPRQNIRTEGFVPSK